MVTFEGLESDTDGNHVDILLSSRALYVDVRCHSASLRGLPTAGSEPGFAGALEFYGPLKSCNS